MRQTPPTYLNLVIISVALLISLGIYVFIPFFIAGQNQWEGWSRGWVLRPDQEILFWVLLGLSFAATMVVINFPRLLPSPKKPEDPIGSPRRGGGEIFLDFKNFTPRVFQLTIIRLAIAESIAVFGLVLAFINQAPWWVVPFAAASFLLQIVFGPLMGVLVKDR